jgi:hypothetical protein
VRTLLHLTAGDFRRRYDGAGMFERFRAELVIPYLDVLRSLRPLTPPPGWAGSARADLGSQRRVDPR